MKKKFLQRISNNARYLIPVLGLVLLGWLYWQYFHSSPLSIEEAAQKIYSECQKANYRPTCYDQKLSSLMGKPDNFSMTDAFKVSRLIGKSDSEYSFCHVLGHKLASIETKKDPHKWKDVIAKCPSGTCSNGCIHGAFQERFRYEYLSYEQLTQIKSELEAVCRQRAEWSPSGIEQGSCYHALGHLLMYVSNADIAKSISLCKELAINERGNSFIQVCLDGVFMQIFQPLETEDFSLIRGKAPTKENLENFCRSFDPDVQVSCWTESWPLMGSEIKQAKSVNRLCSYLNESKKTRCYESLFYIMPVQFRFDLDKNFLFCQDFAAPLRGKCFAQVAQRLVQTDFNNIDKAIAFCAHSVEYDAGETCFAELVSKNNFNFQKNSEQSKYLCSKLPEKWQTLCSQ